MSGLSLPPGTKTPENFYEAHPDFYGHVDQQYADPLARARPASTTPTEGIPSRFGQVAVTETVANTTKHYNVTLNGQPILMVDNQPSVIGVSRTFDLGAEDAIVFSTYNAKDLACSFRHYVLVLSSGANALRPLDNCTRGYQASVKDNSLFISFPETDDARPVGATWRYNDGNLVRL